MNRDQNQPPNQIPQPISQFNIYSDWLRYAFEHSSDYLSLTILTYSERDPKRDLKFKFEPPGLLYLQLNLPLSTPFDIAVLLDDSWSVGAIDFSRQIHLTKLILKVRVITSNRL